MPSSTRGYWSSWLKICLGLWTIWTTSVKSQDSSCPVGVFYSDVTSIRMTCYGFPTTESKPETCYKDFYWKSLATYGWSRGTALYAAPNPYNVPDVPVCARNCLCNLEMTLTSFQCLQRGRPPTWSDLAFGQLRKSFHCGGMELPAAVAAARSTITLQAVIMPLPIALNGFPLIGELASALSRLGFESLVFQYGDQTSWMTTPIMTLDPIMAPGYFPNLTRLDLGTMASNIFPNWTNMDQAMANISPTLNSLKLEGFTAKTMAEPRFASSLRTLLFKGMPYLYGVDWLSKAKNLLFLGFTNVSNIVSSPFRLELLTPVTSLLHLELRHSNLPRFPDNFSFGDLYPNLNSLDLCGMQIATWPSRFFDGLKKLRYLDISGNNLQVLPSMKPLNLETFWMWGIQAYRYSEPISDKIRLTNCDYYLPPMLLKGNISHMTNMRFLDISYFSSLTIDEEELRNLSLLSDFSGKCNNLRVIPSALKYSCRLRSFNFRSNFLNVSDPTLAIPPFIPKTLRNLYTIEMTKCNFRSFPAALYFFNTTINTELFVSINRTMVGNPSAYMNPCETYKLAKAYNTKVYFPSTFNSSMISACDAAMNNLTIMFHQLMDEVPDYCATTVNAADKSIPTVYNLSFFMLALVTFIRCATS